MDYFMYWIVVLCSYFSCSNCAQWSPTSLSCALGQASFFEHTILQSSLAVFLLHPKNCPFLQGPLVPLTADGYTGPFLNYGRDKVRRYLFFSHLEVLAILSLMTLVSPIVLLSIYYILDVEAIEMNDAWNLFLYCSQPRQSGQQMTNHSWVVTPTLQSVAVCETQFMLTE